MPCATGGVIRVCRYHGAVLVAHTFTTHRPPPNPQKITCYGSPVAVLISVDVLQRLMGYPKPTGRFSFVVSVSTRVINAAAKETAQCGL